MPETSRSLYMKEQGKIHPKKYLFTLTPESCFIKGRSPGLHLIICLPRKKSSGR